MDIDYTTIIKYLSNSTSNKNDFEIKKHLIKYSNLFPPKFIDLLQNKFYCYGITQNIMKNKIGFYMSLLTLLNKDFITFTESEEIDYMNSFKSSINLKIINQNEFTLSSEVEKYIKKNNISRKDIINNVDVLLIQCISEILSANFIIFDFNDENIYTVYPDSVLNPWKSTFIFGKYDDLWSPIIYDVNSKRIFSYNDLNIKKIYSNTIEYYDQNNINKNFQILDNIKEIVNSLNEPEPESSESESNDVSEINNEIFIKDEVLTKNKLMKMTKAELLIILKNKDIKNVNMKILKNDLIEMIIKLI